MIKKKVYKKAANDKTLYIWDLADTLFNEVWNQEKTGFPTFLDWLANKLNKKSFQITPREYEEGCKVPYSQGWYFNTDIKPGFRKVLSWTKNNETFTSGTPEQMDWRGEYLNKKYGFSLQKYFKKINSTFDYGETNIKTAAMINKYLKQKYQEGYRTIVYTDDKFANLEMFKQAIDKIQEKNQDFSGRLYHILNNDSGLKKKSWYFVIGWLKDLLKNEKNFKNN